MYDFGSLQPEMLFQRYHFGQKSNFSVSGQDYTAGFQRIFFGKGNVFSYYSLKDAMKLKSVPFCYPRDNAKSVSGSV